MGRFISRLLSFKRGPIAAKQAPEKVASEKILPDGFDRALYLKLNPDVAAAGADPVDHYLQCGRNEGRVYRVDMPGIHEGSAFDDERETILIVSHEASRTGAPILSLNLVQALVKRYNVVALLLGGGSILEAFQSTGAGVVIASNLRGRPSLANLVMQELCDHYEFKFALVNSIESRVVLQELANQFVPTISLIHEFAAYTRPREAFVEALKWSGEVVFSTDVTKENAFSEYPDLDQRAVHIIPQGQCLLPVTDIDEQLAQSEIERIRRLMRPKGCEDKFIVLGAGAVQFRKGVDLFIECAARARSLIGGERCRFVWIGKGFDSQNDVSYSVYLADQVRRANLEGHLIFIEETSALDEAYRLADIMLLSSRLDPLPNVAIDSMVRGVPVLCFDRTTGIAEFLTGAGLRASCVAEYMDTTEMGGKIVSLANVPELYNEISDKVRSTALDFFDMPRYVDQLERLASRAIGQATQENSDVALILASGLYREDFAVAPRSQEATLEERVRTYVRSWASGMGRRKPFPGFHPGIYAELNKSTSKDSDPLASYLRAGQPIGPWLNNVITVDSETPSNLLEGARVALHLHVFYPDLLPEILTRLSQNVIRPDLFISVPSKSVKLEVAPQLTAYSGRIGDVKVVPNRGRDIGPFLTEFGAQLIAEYDLIGHIHTKKSVAVPHEVVGKQWFLFLLENLLGGTHGNMADVILANMYQDKSIGMVFPDDPHVVGFGGNRPFAEKYAERLGVERLPEHFSFPVGTMFWATAQALTPMVNLGLDWNDYPDEPLPYDNSTLHALERLFSLSLGAAKLSYAVTNVVGVTR